MEVVSLIYVVLMSCGNNVFSHGSFENSPFLCLLFVLTCNITEVGVSVLQTPGVIIVVASVLYNVMLSSTVPRTSRLQYRQTGINCIGTGDQVNWVYWNDIKQYGTVQLNRQAKGEQNYNLYVASTNLTQISRGCLLMASLLPWCMRSCRDHHTNRAAKTFHVSSALYHWLLCVRGCHLS